MWNENDYLQMILEQLRSNTSWIPDADMIDFLETFLKQF